MRLKGQCLYVAKRCDEITSFFAAKRTNLILSFSLTHAEGGMASNEYDSVSPVLDHQHPSNWSTRRKDCEIAQQ